MLVWKIVCYFSLLCSFQAKWTLISDFSYGWLIAEEPEKKTFSWQYFENVKLSFIRVSGLVTFFHNRNLILTLLRKKGKVENLTFITYGKLISLVLSVLNILSIVPRYVIVLQFVSIQSRLDHSYFVRVGGYFFLYQGICCLCI